MRHLILATTFAALTGLIFSGPALGAGGQMGGMSQSGHAEGMTSQSQDRTQDRTMVRQLDRDQIREMQRILNNQGYQVGQEDGVIGEKTREALRNFQRTQNLAQTGEPNRETLRALAPDTKQQEFFGLSPSFGEHQEMEQHHEMEQHREMDQSGTMEKHQQMEQNQEKEQQQKGSGY